MIKNILIALGLIKPQRTIDEITAPMRGIVEQLTEFAAAQEALAEEHAAEMLRLSLQVDAAAAEAKCAQGLCRKYSELVTVAP